MWQYANFYQQSSSHSYYVYPAQICTYPSAVVPLVPQMPSQVNTSYITPSGQEDYFCQLCKYFIFGYNNILNHILSAAHQTLVVHQPMGIPSCCWVPGHYFASQFVTHENYTDCYCLLCGIYTYGFSQYYAHVMGKLHEEMVSRYKKQIIYMGYNNYFCNSCDAKITDYKIVHQHVTDSNCPGLSNSSSIPAKASKAPSIIETEGNSTLNSMGNPNSHLSCIINGNSATSISPDINPTLNVEFPDVKKIEVKTESASDAKNVAGNLPIAPKLEIKLDEKSQILPSFESTFKNKAYAYKKIMPIRPEPTYPKSDLHSSLPSYLDNQARSASNLGPERKKRYRRKTPRFDFPKNIPLRHPPFMNFGWNHNESSIWNRVPTRSYRPKQNLKKAENLPTTWKVPLDDDLKEERKDYQISDHKNISKNVPQPLSMNSSYLVKNEIVVKQEIVVKEEPPDYYEY